MKPFRITLVFLSIFLLSPCLAPMSFGSSPCDVEHPFQPPRAEYQGQCPNCGMVRAMWARTWITFEDSKGPHQACSMHCLADGSINSGEEPKNVMVAVYMEPEKMVPADNAYFVIGSKAKGTMTMLSKPAFASKSDAEKFSSECGGEVADFGKAFEMAKAGVEKEKEMSAKRRIEGGKIVEPVDNQDRCPLCRMYPARYPYNKAQIQTKDKRVYHFCSAQCMFEFMEDSAKFAGEKVEPFLIWIADHETGRWISGRSAYYVVGSPKAFGPMGYEAFAFCNKASADKFAAANQGEVLTFDQVTVDKIMPYMKN